MPDARAVTNLASSWSPAHSSSMTTTAAMTATVVPTPATVPGKGVVVTAVLFVRQHPTMVGQAEEGQCGQLRDSCVPVRV